MNNLKHRIKEYNTPLSEEAWIRFFELRKKEKKNLGYLIGLILFLGLMVVTFLLNFGTINNQKTEDLAEEELFIIGNTGESEKLKNEYPILSKMDNNEYKKSNEKHIYYQADQPIGSIYQSENQVSQINNKEIISIKNIQLSSNKKRMGSKGHKTSFGNKEIKPTPRHLTTTNNLEKKQITSLSKLPQLKSGIIFYTDPLESTKPKIRPLEKSKKLYKNIVRTSINYTKPFINGQIGVVPNFENVKKTGFLIQGEYLRLLNTVFGVGASLGYSYSKDRNNQQHDQFDYEKIYFGHINVYLYMWNTSRHKLFIKAGSGYTHTERIHSFPSSTAQSIDRKLQFSRSSDNGFLIEGGYVYQLNPHWIIGLNYGAITHNDGAPFGGLSIGKSF